MIHDFHKFIGPPVNEEPNVVPFGIYHSLVGLACPFRQPANLGYGGNDSCSYFGLEETRCAAHPESWGELRIEPGKNRGSFQNLLSFQYLLSLER